MSGNVRKPNAWMATPGSGDSCPSSFCRRRSLRPLRGKAQELAGGEVSSDLVGA